MPVTSSRVVIVGGGPGGYEAGLVAAQLGQGFQAAAHQASQAAAEAIESQG